MGFDKNRRPYLDPSYGYTVIGSASSAGASIKPRGMWALYSSSTVATTPTVMYLPQGRIGDVVDVFCGLASSSAGAVLRTSSSGTYIASSSMGWDSVQFFWTGGGVRLVQATTTLWACIGGSTTASGTLPLLVTSSS